MCILPTYHGSIGLLYSCFFGMSRNAPKRCVTSQKTAAKGTMAQPNSPDVLAEGCNKSSS